MTEKPDFVAIPTGLLPGIDDKIEYGSLVAFFIQDESDTHAVQKHIQKIVRGSLEQPPAGICDERVTGHCRTAMAPAKTVILECSLK